MNIVRENMPQDLSVPGIGFRTLIRWPLLREIAWFCIFEAAFYFAYRYGMSFSHTCAAPFWFPDSVLLCALLLSSPRRWWLLILAPLPIRLFVEVPPNTPLWFLLGAFAIDSAKGLLTAAVLRRLIKNPSCLKTVEEFALFCLFAVLLIPMAGAFCGAALRHALGYPYWAAWEQWFLGNVLAHMVVTPALFYLILDSPWNAPAPSLKRKIEGGMLTVGLTLAGYLSFNSGIGGVNFTEPGSYAPVPFLFWAAIRFGMFGASGAITLLAAFAVHAAIAGREPFSGLSASDTAHALQQFLLLRAAPLYVVAILIEQKRGDERTLRKSEALNRSIVDSLTGLVVILDRAGRVLAANDAWKTAAPPGGIPVPVAEAGADYLALCRDAAQAGNNSCAEIREGIESLLAGRECHFQKEYSVVTPGGSFWFEVLILPLRSEAGGVVISLRDISIRKRAEAEALELRRELTHASRVTMLGQLSAAFAHELNQPLAAILSNAQAARRFIAGDGIELDELRSILTDIVRDDKRAGAVIQNLRAMASKRPAVRETCCLNELVGEVIELLHAEMVGVRIALRPSLAAALPQVRVSRVELQQVLMNLLINAMHAMKDTPPESRFIEVETHAEPGLVVASIRDHGHGIPTARTVNIFEPFVSTKADGLGMGLSICRRIIENHAGHIDARNHDDGGASFSFSLPLESGVAELPPMR